MAESVAKEPGRFSAEWMRQPVVSAARAPVIFWITALGGVWSAYDRHEALIKFGVISASVILFYLVARSDGLAPVTLAGVGGLVAATAAIVFLLGNDWNALPADFGFIETIGRWWMRIRPAAPAFSTSPNRSAGIIAAFLPFWAAWMRMARREQGGGWFGPRTVGGAIVGTVAFGGLMLTSSRAAWASLVVSVGLVFLLQFIRARSGAALKRLGLPAAVILTVMVVIFFTRSAAIAGWADAHLPGLPSGGSRIQLMTDTIHLALDYPLLGGGLEAFPGLYAYYIRVTPYYLFGYSHNLYLDAAVSQGWIGLAALITTLLGGLGLYLCLTAAPSGQADAADLYLAGLIASGVILLHGWMDDALYGETGSLLLFVIPAAAWWGQRREAAAAIQPPTAERQKRSSGLPRLGGVVLLLTAGAVFYRPMASALLVNLAAIEMAKVQLDGFPTGEWDDGSRLSEMIPAERRLQQALELNPANSGASYRLGIIAMLRRDYPVAAAYLQAAHAGAPGHYGITKTLAYAYVWQGREDLALPLLAQILEARQELVAYSGWWPMQSRPDLAQKAAEMAQRLGP